MMRDNIDSHDWDARAEYISKSLHHPAGRMSAYAMQTITDSPRMGSHLNQMRWSLVTFKNERHTLLNVRPPDHHDQRVIGPNDHLALPIGPRMFFVATNNIEAENMIRTTDAGILMAQGNDRVSSQARRYVYGSDNKQLRFVENRLGRSWSSTPLEKRFPA